MFFVWPDVVRCRAFLFGVCALKCQCAIIHQGDYCRTDPGGATPPDPLCYAGPFFDSYLVLAWDFDKSTYGACLMIVESKNRLWFGFVGNVFTFVPVL